MSLRNSEAVETRMQPSVQDEFAIPTVPRGQMLRLMLGAAVVAVIVWCVLGLQRDLINKDGVLFVEAAEAFKRGDLDRAFAIFPWPFISVAIAGISSMFGISAEVAAHLLNLGYWVVAVAAMQLILRELGGGPRVIACGALLMMMHPQTLQTLSSIFRGTGYAAFLLVGIFAFIRFRKSVGIGWALGSILSLFVATLFRVEGAVVLGLVGTWIGWTSWRSLGGTRAGNRVRFAAVLVVLALIVAAVIWGGRIAEAGVIDRIVDRFSREVRTSVRFVESIGEKSERLGEAALDKYSIHHSVGAFLAARAYVLLVETISGVHPLYIILAFLSLGRTARAGRPGRDVVIPVLIASQLCILAAFAFKNGYLSQRYTVGLGLLVMIPAAFVLSSRFTEWQAGGRVGRCTIPAVALGVAMFITAYDAVIETGVANLQVREAGEWVREHLDDEAVYFQTPRLRYYAGRPWETSRYADVDEALRELANDGGERHAFAVLELHPGSEPDELGADLSPVASFSNERGAMAVVFRVGGE